MSKVSASNRSYVHYSETTHRKTQDLCSATAHTRTSKKLEKDYNCTVLPRKSRFENVHIVFKDYFLKGTNPYSDQFSPIVSSTAGN